MFQSLWKRYHLQCCRSISPMIPSSRKHFNSRLPSLMLLININTKFNVAVRVQRMLYSLKLRQWALGELHMSSWQTLDNIWTLPMVYWFGFKLLKLASHTLLLPPHRIIKSTKSLDTFSRHLTNITLCHAQHRWTLYCILIVLFGHPHPPQSSQLQPHWSGTPIVFPCAENTIVTLEQWTI